MLKLLSALLSVAVLPAPALYATTFDYSLTAGTPGDSFSVSGTMSGPADPYVAGAYDIDGITGAASSYAFSGIVNGGTNSQKTAMSNGITFDNVLYLQGSKLVDASGFLLDLTSTAGVSLAHVYYASGTTPGYEVDVMDPGDPGDVTKFSVSNFSVSSPAVPEPGTLTLLGTGLVAVAAAGRRRLRGR